MFPKLRPFLRMKPKAKALPTAAERAHMNRVALLPCLGCFKHGVELHHAKKVPGGKTRNRDHRFVVPLCADCHRGKDGVHGLSEEGFNAKLGFEIGRWAKAEWERHNG